MRTPPRGPTARSSTTINAVQAGPVPAAVAADSLDVAFPRFFWACCCDIRLRVLRVHAGMIVAEGLRQQHAGSAQPGHLRLREAAGGAGRMRASPVSDGLAVAQFDGRHEGSGQAWPVEGGGPVDGGARPPGLGHRRAMPTPPTGPAAPVMG